jgi:hypothetical protein
MSVCPNDGAEGVVDDLLGRRRAARENKMTIIGSGVICVTMLAGGFFVSDYPLDG